MAKNPFEYRPIAKGEYSIDRKGEGCSVTTEQSPKTNGPSFSGCVENLCSGEIRVKLKPF